MGTPFIISFVASRSTEYERVPGGNARADGNDDRFESFLSAEIDILRTIDRGPCPLIVITIRVQKYIDNIIAIIKYSQNQIVRFMALIIS